MMIVKAKVRRDGELMEVPAEELVPGDIISTIYHCLGIRGDSELHDRLGRPHRLVPAGNVVPALLA